MTNSSFLDFLWEFIPPNKQQLFLERVKVRTRFLTVVLEDIYQPHNASAVMRTCDCFGIQDVHVIENRNEWEYRPEVERGSSKWLSINRYNSQKNNTLDCMERLKGEGYEIVATSPHTNISIQEFCPKSPLALVMGNEDAGVSDGVLQNADHLVKIPMVGFTESLNLSVAAAICIHHITNYFQTAEINWQLTDLQQEAVLMEWCKKMLKNHELYFRRFTELQKG